MNIYDCGVHILSLWIQVAKVAWVTKVGCRMFAGWSEASVILLDDGVEQQTNWFVVIRTMYFICSQWRVQVGASGVFCHLFCRFL